MGVALALASAVFYGVADFAGACWRGARISRRWRWSGRSAG
ncbi:hypothetical protein ACFQHO_46520 [Actinomadura yumaensis]